MIQRIQSLFLTCILILSALLFFLPFQEINSGENKLMLCLMPGCLKELVHSTIYLPFAINSLVIILSAVSIFLFKKRILQMKISLLIVLLSVILFGCFFTFDFIKDSDSIGAVNFKVAAFIPIINGVLAILARRFIKKDEELVRSADRIR